MTGRYALKNEYRDCTLSDPFSCFTNKAEAIRVARHLAKNPTEGSDVVRVWVDDKKTELGVKAFEVRA